MNALTALHFDTSDIRMVLRDDEPWWVLADVAAALGMSNPSKLAGRLNDYQKADIPIRDSSSGQNRRVIIVNEAGIYQLTLSSRIEGARRFGKWLFTEVLPSIRKFGMYPPPADKEIIANDPYDGRDKTLAERFREERLRFEAREGHKLEDANGFSKQKIIAIENQIGWGRDPKLVMAMVLAEMDALYVLRGDRQYSIWEQQNIARLRDVQHQMLLDTEIQKDTF